jgi:hypothetical protein
MHSRLLTPAYGSGDSEDFLPVGVHVARAGATRPSVGRFGAGGVAAGLGTEVCVHGRVGGCARKQHVKSNGEDACTVRRQHTDLRTRWQSIGLMMKGAVPGLDLGLTAIVIPTPSPHLARWS